MTLIFKKLIVIANVIWEYLLHVKIENDTNEINVPVDMSCSPKQAYRLTVFSICYASFQTNIGIQVYVICRKYAILLSVCSINSTTIYVTCFLSLMIHVRDLCVLLDVRLPHIFHLMLSISSCGWPVFCFMSFPSGGQMDVWFVQRFPYCK